MAQAPEPPSLAVSAPPPAWTGGQYSLWRVALGLTLGRELLGLPASDAGLSGVLVVAGLIASVAIVLGRRDSLVAAALALLLAVAAHGDVLEPTLVERDALLYFVLLLHALAPPAPYLSWDARGRVDPGGGWRFPTATWGLAWMTLVMVSSVAVLGILAPVAGLLELPTSGNHVGTTLWALVVPSVLVVVAGAGAVWRPLRPWIWIGFVVGWAVGVAWGAGDLPGAWLLVALAFDPGWIPAREGARPSMLFYDGACGLCHRTVRLVLAEDRQGDALYFAPLQADIFQRTVPVEYRAELPDSIVVVTPTNELLVRSDAALHVAARLGGLWRLGAAVATCVPRPLRDAVYDAVARVRKRVFPMPDDACPIVPPELAGRFLV